MIFETPNSYFIILKKPFYLLSWKSLSCIKFLNWKIFPNGIQIFFQTPLSFLNGRSHSIFTQGFCVEKNLNSWRSESKYESLGKSSYSLSFNFQKFTNSTHFQSINQTINPIYMFIITFQNLEFWDVTNLPPLKWISSSRFGEARKK